MRLFLARRYQFANILQSSTSAITTSRFLRLMALAAMQIAFNLPVVIYSLIIDTTGTSLQPYSSWQDVHYGFSEVESINRVEWAQLELRPRELAELSYWTYPVSCAVFFLFFGLGEESLGTYQAVWRWVSACCKRKSSRTPVEYLSFFPSNAVFVGLT